MAVGDLDDELRAFIGARFHSIEQLEILLLLRGEPDRAWSPRAVFDHIRSSVASVCLRLEELLQAGFLEPHDAQPQTFRYAPKTAQLSGIGDRLAEAYKFRRVAVVQAIYGNTAASELANAFKFRRPKS